MQFDKSHHGKRDEAVQMAMFNIKTIKLYGWEDIFKNRITKW
jgi:hypothetical protein